MSPGNSHSGIFAVVAGVEDPQAPGKSLCIAFECAVGTGLPVRVPVQQHEQRAFSEWKLSQQNVFPQQEHWRRVRA